MPTILVAGNRPRVGKTAVCAALARILADDGVSVGVTKPLNSAAAGDSEDLDSSDYAALLGTDIAAGAASSSGLASQAIANFQAHVEQASAGHDVMLVESSAQLGPDVTATAAEAIDASVLLTIGYEPDFDPESLAPWREALGDRLAYTVVNGVTDYRVRHANSELVPALEAAGLKPAGCLPEDRLLLAVKVDEIARHFDGEYVVDEGDKSALVSNILVGCQTLDPGELYFGIREDKAVVVRGDRPDIQMAALSTPTACMVITKNMMPIEYIRYEAGEEEVPVILTEADTLTAMDMLDTVQERARFDHPAKLERMTALLRERLDLDALRSALGLSNPNTLTTETCDWTR